MLVEFKKFKNKKLSQLKFEGHSFNDCVFSDCYFTSLSMRNCEFEACDFINCVFKVVETNFTKIIDCCFKNCYLQGMQFTNLSLPHSFDIIESKVNLVDFDGLNLQKSVFTNTHFSECYFSHCVLKYSDFSHSEFNSTEFRYTDLTGCNFTQTVGFDVDHEMNNLAQIIISLTTALKILKRMGIIVE